MNTDIFTVQRKKFEPGSDLRKSMVDVLLENNGKSLMYTIVVPGKGVTYDQAAARITEFVVKKVPENVTDKIAYIDKQNLFKNIPNTNAGKSKNRKYFDMVLKF